MRPYPMSTDELVDDVIADLDRVNATVRARFGTLSSEQLRWQPSPKRWGVGHCLAHLTRTNELYRETLSGALRAGGSARGAERLHGRWFGRLFTRSLAPGGGGKVRTPEALRPRQGSVEGPVLETFLAEQHRLRALADEARGMDLDALRIASPVASWVKLTAGDALRAVAAHELRHLAQAERVLEDERFPR